VDLRILAATNDDPEKRVRRRRFPQGSVLMAEPDQHRAVAAA
jgi:hypothetical protein